MDAGSTPAISTLIKALKTTLQHYLQIEPRCLNLTTRPSEDKPTQKGSYSMCKRSERRESIKRKMMNFYRSHPCTDCGETDPRVLDFDHLNNKKHNVSTLMSKEYSWEAILEEASKCEVRCANCHRKKTAVDQNHYTNRLLLEYF